MRDFDPIKPGEILEEEFLVPLGISRHKLAKDTNVDHMRYKRIIENGSSITADTALRLAKYFGNTPEFWMNLQSHYELEKTEAERHNEIELIETIAMC